MRTRRQLIDEDRIIRSQEHFDAQRTYQLQRVGDLVGRLVGFFGYRRRDAGRHNRFVQNIVDVDIFGDREHRRFTFLIAYDHDRKFFRERNPSLQNADAVRCQFHGFRFVRFRFQDNLSLTIIPETGRF